MAEVTLTAAVAAVGLQQPRQVHAGLNAMDISYKQDGVTVSASHVIQVCKVPIGAKIWDLRYACNISNANGCTVSIGDSSDPSLYAAAASSTTAFTDATLGMGTSYSAEDAIVFHVTACASATATGSWRIMLTYLMDDKSV